MALLLNGNCKRLGAAELSHEHVVSLRDWLDGHWAVVFSHPEDFAPHPSTPCGFIACLADGILAAGIKPIVWATSLLDPISSWLDHAFNDDAVVVLNAEDHGVVDLSERTLAARLQRPHQRFVLIADENGRHRTTLTYTSTRDRPRTLLDVVEVIAELRDSIASHRRSNQDRLGNATSDRPTYAF